MHLSSANGFPNLIQYPLHEIAHTHTTEPRSHSTSLQAVAREEAPQVRLLPEAVYLCTEATAAALRQTHTSGMQVRSTMIKQNGP